MTHQFQDRGGGTSRPRAVYRLTVVDAVPRVWLIAAGEGDGMSRPYANPTPRPDATEQHHGRTVA